MNEIFEKISADNPRGALFPDETPFLLSLIPTAVKVSKTLVEIGTLRGRTARLIAILLDALDLPGSILSIDPSPRIPSNSTSSLSIDGRVIYIRMLSTEAAKHLVILPSLVFIDGCHCFECCTNDIDAWANRISTGGFLVFHDATDDGHKVDPTQTQHSDETTFGVGRAIEQNRFLKEHFEWHDAAHNGHIVAFKRIS